MNKKRVRKIIFLLPLFAIPFLLVAQENNCQDSDNKQAVKFYEKGTNIHKYEKQERLDNLQKALQLEPDYAAANFAYAEELIKTLIYQNAPFKPTEKYFLKVVQTCPHYHSDPYYFLGFSYYEQEKYNDAITYLNQFIAFKDEDEKKFSKDYDSYLSNAKQMLKFATFYANIFKHPVPFDPKPVAGICTPLDEYLPIISPDNQYCFFTRRMPPDQKASVAVSDQLIEVFSSSERQSNGIFDRGDAMPPPFNQNSNEGGATISIDNKHLYYTICKDEGGQFPNCDIYTSDFVNGEWTEIRNMGPNVNDPVYWDSQPSISADGNTLYFASDRPGGYGKIDIYKTVRDPKTGEWEKAVNLGPTINTAGNEKSPFIHSDSQTLYFSSDGLPGIGGYDIFYSRADSNGKWQTPVNIGYPINTAGDDLGFFASTDGHLGYFASNDPNRVKGTGIGGWDIFSFDLYKDARPEKVAFIKGMMKDENGNVVKNASVEIKDVVTKKKVGVVVDTATGEYAAVVNIQKKHDYILTIRKKGSAFNSQLITSADSFSQKPVVVNFQIKPVVVGKSYELHNIYYETNSSELKKISLSVINEFADFLKLNPKIKIEVQGFTDNVGDEKDNLALSNDRAFTVREVLKQHGIAESRMKFKGYGSSNPIAPNDTDQGRAKNRRTQFLILEK
ncbi:MAG: OmpA family protein [Bacteroidia bacterium]